MARGEVKKISALFDKYKEILFAPEGVVIDGFLEVVDDLLGFKLDKKKVRYTPSTKTLVFLGAGTLKSEIRLREQEILTHLTGRIGEKNSPRKII
jgi:hypothetical protein